MTIYDDSSSRWQIDSTFYKRVSKTVTIVMLLLALAIVLYLDFNTDYTAATQDDIDPLIYQAMAIQEDSKRIFTQDGVLTVNGDKITYSTENSEAELVFTFDKDLNIVSYEIHDKAITILRVIPGSLIVLLILSFGFFGVGHLVLYLVFLIMEKIDNKSKKALSD
jgi:hypothetical protein